MASDHDRRQLYAVLERHLGQGPAATLMELLPLVGWADVARQSDITALRGEMAELRAQLRGEMAELRAETVRLGARIDAQIPRFVWANVPIMFGVAGLVLAAARLA
jgi:hypothetical protein